MIGQTISHYRITDKLGEGGMREVYRATDTKLNRDVALKSCLKLSLGTSSAWHDSLGKRKVLASLSHPNIGAIFGLEEAEGKTRAAAEAGAFRRPGGAEAVSRTDCEGRGE